MRIRPAVRATLAALAALALGMQLAGCGQKGPLTLPDRKGHAAKPAGAVPAQPAAQPGSSTGGASGAAAPTSGTPAGGTAAGDKKNPDHTE